jgi:hypothetical protein
MNVMDASGEGATPEPDASDQGEVSTTYPPFAVDTPHILANAGTVLKAPVVVTVTWPAQDTTYATWDAFGDSIGASTYWNATTREYGVGPVVSGPSNHVHMMDSLPSTMSYYDLEGYVTKVLGGMVGDGGSADSGPIVEEGGLDAGEIDGSASDSSAGGASSGDSGNEDAPPSGPWPPPVLQGGNAQTIYSLLIPSSTAVTDPGSGMPFCSEGGLGYHDNVMVGTTPIAYAVTLECTSQTLAYQEETASHEYVEAATNPYPETMNLGYIRFDTNHYAWEIYTGFNDELADACENWEDSYVQQPDPFPYWVQRSWSNERASAGHAPCVPDPGTPYAGMTLFASQESTVSVDLTSIGMSKVSTLGFSAGLGRPATFQVGFYSDAPTGAWAISYDFPKELPIFDAQGNPVANGAATVTIDRTSGQNGEKANVRVTPTRVGPLGFQIMAITWDPPSAASMYSPHYLPIVISNE